MKNTFPILLTAALGLASAAQAQDGPVLYGELNAGAVFPSGVSIERFEFADGAGGDFLDASLDFGIGVAGGAEVGWQNLFTGNFRFGVSYDYLQVNVDSVSVSGSVGGEPFAISVNVSGPVILDDGSIIALEVDDQLHAVLGNLYWQASGQALEPFLGVGMGTVYINNSGFNLAAAGTAGARYHISDRTYVGAKYKYVRAFDVSDDFGLNYDDVSAHVVYFTFGGHY